MIAEIPDHKLCHIEGRNGIGKTLSIRLLELISGTQPYSTLPHAWASLREQLGPVTVTFTGLAEGQLEVHLTPEDWPNGPDPIIDRVGTATLDGEPISMEQVRELVHVHRIAGDETLSETLALELAKQAAHARQLDEDVAPTIAAWDTELQDLAELVANISVDQLDLLQSEKIRCARRSKAVGAELEETVVAVASTTSALAGIRSMRERQEKLTGLLDELEVASRQLKAQELNVEDLTARMEELSKERNLDAIESDLRLWNNRSRYRAKAWSKALVAERQMLRALGLDLRPAEAERRHLMREAAAEVSDLQKQLDAFDNVGGLKTLLSSLDDTLGSAPAAVDDEIIVREPAEVTADLLRSGVRERRDELEGVPRPDDVEDLYQRHRAALLRVARLTRLADLISTSNRKEELLADASEMISELWDQVDDSTSLRPLSENLRQAVDLRLNRALTVVACAQTLVQLLGTRPIDTSSLVPTPSEAEAAEATEDDTSSNSDEDDADAPDAPDAPDAAGKPPSPADPTDRSQWEAIASELDDAATQALAAYDVSQGVSVPPAQLLDEIVATLTERRAVLTADVQDLDEESVIARRNARAAQQAMTVYVDRCSKNLTILRTDERWDPYRTGIEALLGLDDAEDIAKVSAAIDRVGTFVTTIRMHMSAVRDGLGQLGVYLDAESAGLTGRGDPRDDVTRTLDQFGPSRQRQRRVREWAENQLAELVGSEALRNELFDGAATVAVDLRKATVSWESPSDGRIRQRPFEAFSSGEQVFAYTKAKLELLRDSPPSAGHVLVVLDEFGAFVARDRFGQLMQFVAEDALDSIAEQIVVILPLADDYLLDSNAEELVRASGSEQGSTYLDRIAQLSERQYFAVPASAP